jgi:Glycosyl transferases group 1
MVHLSPREHRAFYNAQKFTLNITRSDMRAAGYSPSVRLFEAAACATPIISDHWDGIGKLFEMGEEILISHSAANTLKFLREMPEEERRAIGERARQRVLREHTAAHRAEELENFLNEAITRRSRTSRMVMNGHGGTGDSPVPFGHWPNGMEARSRPKRARENSKVTPIPSGESPDGTGGSPVLPKILRPAYSPENYVYFPAL